MKLKKGDQVSIVAGKDNGKKGTVEKVFAKESKVLVEGVNQYKRHLKGRMANQKSEIITITKPLPISNVLVVCPKCNKPTRIGFLEKDNKKVRVCRKCKKQI